MTTHPECTGTWLSPTTHVNVPSEWYEGNTYAEVTTQRCTGCGTVLVTCNGRAYPVEYADDFGRMSTVAAFGIANMEAISADFNPWM